MSFLTFPPTWCPVKQSSRGDVFQQYPNLGAGAASRSAAKMWPSASILCVLVAFANARSIPYYPPLSSDLVNHINKLNTTWKVSADVGLGVR